MNSINIPAAVEEMLAIARTHSSGRSGRTIHGGHENHLRQTLLALAAGRDLADHEAPGEATLQVIHGRVSLTAGEDTWEGGSGDYLIIPPERHRLDALEDSVVLLTVSVATRTE